MVPFKERRSGGDRRSGKDRRKSVRRTASASPPFQFGAEWREPRDVKVQLKKDLSHVWNIKGKELLKQNEYEDAKKAFTKAIEIKPKHAEAWYNLAGVCSFKGEIEEALSRLEEAIEIEAGFKEKAKTNKYFRKLQDNEAFKRLVD